MRTVDEPLGLIASHNRVLGGKSTAWVDYELG